MEVKKRSKLPKEYQDIYVKQYKENRAGKSRASALAQWCEEWMHKQVALDADKKKETLEVGAGNMNHLAYELSGKYDIVEPFTELYEHSLMLSWARNEYRDIANVPRRKFYDRIISIATFEHILDLERVVKKTTKILRKDGVLRVAIPNEGCWLWTLGWTMTTGLEFWLRYRLKYSILMRHEHVNTADEIDVVLRKYYKSVKVRYFGIGKHFSLYRFYECHV
jgi:2-polyprenyl-3-methyl-5-hydroxy-6-metoxy-1,4-benzoquinol methylase